MEYPRWSEWRKWDLHIHSLYTHLNNNYWWCSEDNFIAKIKESKISAIWLTNYFNFSENDFLLKEKLDNCWIVTFLNLELRLAYQNNEDQNCDFHIIFDNKIEISLLQSFLANLSVKIWRTEKKANQISWDELKTWVVEFQELLQKLEDESLWLKDKYLLWYLSRWHGTSRSARTYEYIDSKSDFLIHSSDEPNNLKQDREFWLTYNKPLIQSSDSHSLEQVGSKFTWIKWDLTFNWLKQIKYEPEDRIKIQEHNPNFDFDKPYFNNIMVKEDIEVYWEDSGIKLKKTKIDLNNSLVAIIWWRWTGKSTLIWCINNVFNHNGDFFDDETFEITYAKNNDEAPTFEQYNSWNNNYLDYIYISQWYLKENSDKEKISKYIKDLLSIDVDFSSNIIDKLNINKENIEKIENWLKETDLEWNQVNNEDFVNTQKEKYEQMLKSIETDKNKKDLVLYTNNVENISRLQIQINKLEKLLNSINSIKNINDEIQTINWEYNEIEWFKTIWDIDYSTQISTIEENKEILTNKMNTLKSNNNWIKNNFSWYTWDLESLLLNAEVYRKNISKAEEQLQKIWDKKKELDLLYEERKWFWELIYNEYRRLKSNIDEWWNNITLTRNSEQKELIEKLLLKKDWDNGIKVEWSIDFDEKKFYMWLLEILDGRTYKKDNDIKEKIHIEDFESWCEYIKNWFEDFVDNPKFIDYFLNLNKRSSYIKVNSNISYRWRTLKHLSVGQRGTVLLCLQLATKAFSVPIIFDQPEDDLDNQFIMEELVEIFKELKHYRQIIIVTHNANLVINADAEQVIIAENNDESLTYRTWSIEDEIIRNKICEILEWWEIAFRKRENKYWLV